MRFIGICLQPQRGCVSPPLRVPCLSSRRGEAGLSIEQAGCVLIFLLLNLVTGESLGSVAPPTLHCI